MQIAMEDVAISETESNVEMTEEDLGILIQEVDMEVSKERE